MARVFVLGSLNIDVTYYMKDLPKPGETIASRESWSAVGGKGTNQAAAAGWTGTKSYLIGAVGTDENAGMVRKELEKFNVDLTYLYQVEQPTGSAVIFVEDSAANMIVVNGGANLNVPVKPVDFAEGDWIAAQLETRPETVKEYFKMARSAGAHTMLNVSPYQDLDEEFLKLIDLLIVNEHEMGQLIQCPVLDAQDVYDHREKLMGMGIGSAVVTLGDAGAVVITADQFIHCEGEKVKAVDTQGAGDAFAGVLVGNLAKGSTLSEAAAYANKIAAKCVEIAGSTLISISSIS